MGRGAVANFTLLGAAFGWDSTLTDATTSTDGDDGTSKSIYDFLSRKLSFNSFFNVHSIKSRLMTHSRLTTRWKWKDTRRHWITNKVKFFFHPHEISRKMTQIIDRASSTTNFTVNQLLCTPKTSLTSIVCRIFIDFLKIFSNFN